MKENRETLHRQIANENYLNILCNGCQIDY